ncbi:glycoside hydrolase family 2 protein [Prolixibacteraceae bacterium JC049]|nr:glycoside hydrolase family 2 protein [Prolixibacteraceae bacterium JC049]
MRGKRIHFFLPLLMCFIFTTSWAKINEKDRFSKAGFWEVPNSGRINYNFNIGWRFIKGNAANAYLSDFDDSQWDVVNCPHGLELITTEASGSNNYQGVAWYRKHFSVPQGAQGKVMKLHFEGVMGKCKVYLNGEKIGENYGGFLPFNVNLTGKLNANGKNVIAVWVDNSDDPDYPPGQRQDNLDFSYFGGIYRDVYLVATNSVYITNAIEAKQVASGGIFTHISQLDDKKATVDALINIQNDNSKNQSVTVEAILKDKEGKSVAKSKKRLTLKARTSANYKTQFGVSNPDLWSPWSPDLYRLEVRVLGRKGNVLDGVASRVGIRKIEFKGKQGFFLNNKPYPGKLIGANRHQDHAIVGNAMSNGAQWRDAKLLKDGGCDVIRAAHYPVDAAFMEACDELGLFYIVATPGWQFWNDKPIFKQRVYRDIRNMVRRDRNYACVLMWEPILNETWYPNDFAKRAHEIVHEEYPFQGAFTVCDSHARGQEHFDIIYSHPYKSEFYRKVQDKTAENFKRLGFNYADEDRCVFTREWGDCVDDWSAHNSPSRIQRNWGERAQLIQAKHYANPDYIYTSWEGLYDMPAQHVGGTLWHSFDHQRGGHPDTFFGGITDIYRQPKYSYYMFASQRDVSKDNAPMVYVAHQMKPISEEDVTVFTNCDEVRLIVYEQDTLVQKVANYNQKMPHPMVVFKDVFDFIDVKNLHRAKKQSQASLVAEGLIDGKVVARFKRMPSKKPTQIVLSVEDKGKGLVANGSDFVCVVASMVDKDGIVRRLNREVIRFEIEGEGEIIGDESVMANPKRLEWGTAPILVRSTLKAGKIKIKASVYDPGMHKPAAGELVLESMPSSEAFIYSEIGKESIGAKELVNKQSSNEELQKEVKRLKKEISVLKLKEIERGQEQFEGGRE